MTTYQLERNEITSGKERTLVAHFFNAMGLPQGSFHFRGDCHLVVAHAAAQNLCAAIDATNRGETL